MKTVTLRGKEVELPWTHKSMTPLSSGREGTKTVRIANRTYDHADFVTMGAYEKRRLIALDTLFDFMTPSMNASIASNLHIDGPATADMAWYWINLPGRLKKAEDWIADKRAERAEARGH